MSIVSDMKLRELEERVIKLEAMFESKIEIPKEQSDLPMYDKIMGEIKAIKMRMARNDGK